MAVFSGELLSGEAATAPTWVICAPDQTHHATQAMHCKRALELHVSAAELVKLTLFSKLFKAGKTSVPAEKHVSMLQLDYIKF